MDSNQPQNLDTPISSPTQNTNINIITTAPTQDIGTINQKSLENRKSINKVIKFFIALLLMTFILICVLLYFAINKKPIINGKSTTNTKKIAVVSPALTPNVSYLVLQYLNPFGEKFISLYINSFADYINPFKLTSTLGSKKMYYPISTLSNCSGPKECREYCNKYENRSKCESYAFDNNIYKKPIIDFNNLAIKESIEKGLGCSGSNSCLEVCSKEENYQKCTDFAQRNHIPGGKQIVDYSTILSKAKDSLNCTSLDTCRTFCDKEENRNACTDFANKIGIGAGLVNMGPGGCNSEDLCSKFCLITSNHSVCEQFKKDNSL